jgi:hypothetical protein
LGRFMVLLPLLYVSPTSGRPCTDLLLCFSPTNGSTHTSFGHPLHIPGNGREANSAPLVIFGQILCPTRHECFNSQYCMPSRHDPGRNFGDCTKSWLICLCICYAASGNVPENYSIGIGAGIGCPTSGKGSTPPCYGTSCTCYGGPAS